MVKALGGGPTSTQERQPYIESAPTLTEPCSPGDGARPAGGEEGGAEQEHEPPELGRLVFATIAGTGMDVWTILTGS